MSPSAVAFRTAGPDDVATMADWAAAEGWNPGLEDAAAFHATDPQGFFVAEAGGAAVAAISVVNHSDSFAFLGFYICRPDFRRRGVGLSLWRHALDHAGDRTVGLDGVADQERNYARSGFVRVGSSVRLEGRLDPVASPQIRQARTGDSKAITALDRRATGYARNAFLRAWTAPQRTRKTLVLDPDGVRGYATIRLCREGAKIGPLVAPDVTAAVALAQAALEALPADKAIIDVPSSNRALTGRLTGAGFVETFATARMYRGPAPRSGPDLQAIGTMELG